MAFELPPLPYAYDALEPTIDQETMTLHHDKHHKAYTDKLNEAVEADAGLQGKSIEELLANLEGKPPILRNNGGGLVREYVGAVAAFVPDQAGQTLRFLDASESVFAYKDGNVLYNWTCSKPTSALKINTPAQWKGKVAVLLNMGSASASEMFSQNIKQGSKAILVGEPTYGVGNTSTFILELPAKRGVSVTAGRVSVGGQAATEKVTPEIKAPDDKAALAATGIDDALQIALAELRK